MKTMHRNRAIGLAVLGFALATTGCASVKSHLPNVSRLAWWHKVTPAPQPVRELDVTVPAELATPVVLQFWERNTLVIDIQDVASAGQITLTRREGLDWPARVAFRMSPTRFEALEVKGAQRVVLPVANGGSTPVTVELPASAYNKATPSLGVRWGTSSSF
jgi:hypothetical protein